MTKQNIIDIVSDATGLTKVETEAVMNGVMKTIIDSLAENNRVELEVKVVVPPAVAVRTSSSDPADASAVILVSWSTSV